MINHINNHFLLRWLCLILFFFSACDSQDQKSINLKKSPQKSQMPAMAQLKALENQILSFYEQQKGIRDFFKTGYFFDKENNTQIPLISMPCLFPDNCALFFEYLQEMLHLSPYRLVQKNPRKIMRDEYQSVIPWESYYAGVVYQNPSLPTNQTLVMALRLRPEPFLSVIIHSHPSLSHEDLLSIHPQIALLINPHDQKALMQILSRLKREFLLTFQKEEQGHFPIDDLQIQALQTLDFLGIYDQSSILDPELVSLLDLCESRKITFFKNQSNMRLSDQQKFKTILHQRQIRSYPDFKTFTVQDLDEIDGMINFQGQAFVEFKPQSKEDLSKILEFLDKMLQKKVRLIRLSELAL